MSSCRLPLTGSSKSCPRLWCPAPGTRRVRQQSTSESLREQRTGLEFGLDLHLKLLGVSLVAAGLASVGPAHAGVVLKKSETRKVFQVEPGAAPATPQAKPPSSGERLSLPSFGINIGTVAIPAAVMGLGAAAVLGLKLDEDLPKFFDETIVKDSGSYAGYENVLKSENGKVAGTTKLTKPTGKPKVAKTLPKSTSGFITLNIGKK